MPILENWSIIRDNNDPYLAPELRTTRLNGDVFNDEKMRFENGTNISTSRLKELNIKNGYARTLNTTYVLGKVSEEFQNFMNDNGYKIEDYCTKE